MSLKQEIKVALEHALLDQKLASELDKRLISSVPSSKEECLSLVSSFDLSLDKKLEKALERILCNEASAKKMMAKLNLICDILMACSKDENAEDLKKVEVESLKPDEMMYLEIALASAEAAMELKCKLDQAVECAKSISLKPKEEDQKISDEEDKKSSSESAKKKKK